MPPLVLKNVPGPAVALRPFVSTDAAVAGPGELEVELGYAGFRRQAGTTMQVDGLFARFPARKKFLRGRSAEAAACVQAIAPLALAFPEVQFAMLVDGREALRTPVHFGRSSVNTIEILDGLNVGDQVILSDTSAYDSRDRIKLN